MIEQIKASQSVTDKVRYFTAWRWHFYAGLFVIPFMLMLSFTRLIMLFDKEIESARYANLLVVEPQEEYAVPSLQLAAVRKALPGTVVTQYIPPRDFDAPSRFSVRFPDETTRFVLVNPYTAEVIGLIDRSDSWYELANDIHGTLLIGDLGDYLIEIAASFSILLLVSGLYMWWPRDETSKAGFLKIRTGSGTRTLMRDLHANLGGVFSLVLLFFILSGLAWAGVWGGKLVQPWGSFPAERSKNVPQSTLTHKSLNHGSEEEMPWNLELTQVPASVFGVRNVGIDEMVSMANDAGFTHYKLRFPSSETGVFTLSANTMSGDITNPTQDRTMHVDRYSGDVLADIGFDDYNLLAKSMAAGIALHKGGISVVNKIANVFFCSVFIVIALTGGIMWWKRRPKGAGRLAAPPSPVGSGFWVLGFITLTTISVLFPLAGTSVVAIVGVDWLVFRKIPAIKHAIN
ncbi:PepSY-associated TM helix domain-containing protein [Enterovibrio nigricans]|uniref:Uncharacterized iron-regulated membrane protein n=1 Tax=Enterovibrio nigricans DSM 22720 TaxID=1121868 RepID=A0A1T4VLS3_9GAMM|nr:PepSY domain-containing protein [Enterovibrio nigricans]PKF49630.1 PepSY domain-containing protein [Enterovibrio nigricans]SKA65808.1 Uncharacterized iron-regulated membrane protein [Enterovibrio nigricans DSM 22720]